MALLPLSAWRAEHLRLTAFPMPGSTTRSAEWWQQVTGVSPEEQTANPKKGLTDVSGVFGDGKLVLHLEPERIDWRLVPHDIDLESVRTGDSVEMPNVGPFTDAVRIFSEFIGDRWLGREDLPEIGRIAFGAVLYHPEEDRGAGYSRLPDYVPVQVNPESSDFLFQINLPTAANTAIAGRRINRLSKWSVAAFRAFTLRLVVGGDATGATTPTMSAFRLELDINTAPGEAEAASAPLPKDKLAEIFRELVTKGTEIVAQGVRGI